MKFKSYLMVILGTFICALSFNVFFAPYNILPGGVSGVAIILHKLYDLTPALSIVLLSFMCLLIGLIFLSKEEITRSLIGTFFFPIFVYLTSFLVTMVNLSIDNMLVSAIVGGLSFGVGLGIVYREGATTGGVDLFREILNKYCHLSFENAALVMDIIVCLLAIFTLSFELFIYSVIAVFLSVMASDKVIMGISGSKSFHIITSKPFEVEKLIIERLGHGVTILKGKGAFSKEDRYILYVVIPTRDYYRLKDGLKKIDPDAFFFVASSYEVSGGK